MLYKLKCEHIYNNLYGVTVISKKPELPVCLFTSLRRIVLDLSQIPSQTEHQFSLTLLDYLNTI